MAEIDNKIDTTSLFFKDLFSVVGRTNYKIFIDKILYAIRPIDEHLDKYGYQSFALSLVKSDILELVEKHPSISYFLEIFKIKDGLSGYPYLSSTVTIYKLKNGQYLITGNDRTDFKEDYFENVYEEYKDLPYLEEMYLSWNEFVEVISILLLLADLSITERYNTNDDTDRLAEILRYY